MIEIWKPVLGFETSYEVSNLGRVRSIDKLCKVRGGGLRLRKGRILTPRIRFGYNILNLSDRNTKQTIRVPRMVLDAFVGQQPTQVARHKDGSRLNDALCNLEWGTYSENNLDKYKHGTMLCGEKCVSAKLKESEVRNIRNQHNSGVSITSIAASYKLSRSTISDVVNGRSWKHVR